jgi:uncharacterized protein (TIRG00374 family)
MTESHGQADARAVAEVTVPRRSQVRNLLRWGLAALALGFVVWLVPLRDRCTTDGCVPGLVTTVRGTDPTLLVVALVAYLASTLAWSARWRALLQLANVDIGLVQAWRRTLEAQTGGILLPGGLGGDALRVAYVRERAPTSDLAKVIASIFVDRVVGLVTLASLATLSALAFGTDELGPALYLLAAIPIAAVLGFMVLRHPRLAHSRLLTGKRTAKIIKPMLEYAADERGPRALAKGVLFSLLVSALQLVGVRLLVAALGSKPHSEAGVYVGATFGMMIAALPATPGAWGTADAAYVLFLGRAGVAAPFAAAVCLLYRVFWYATAVIGAASAVGRRKK